MNCKKLKSIDTNLMETKEKPSSSLVDGDSDDSLSPYAIVTNPAVGNIKRLKLSNSITINSSSNNDHHHNSHQHHQTGFSNEDDTIKTKKPLNKANENLKQILMMESNEEINKKDAIYAYNYFERIEEVLKEKNDIGKFVEFQNILKKFDPSKDRVANLYNKIENLFLPDYSELVETFLTFLLPSQAAEIGKFFEYFMLSNMQNFINKLNIYFNKQPSQIKKVYAVLNELSDDKDLTMDKIKLKVLPLLKGNQFLTDWFLQLFPSEPPPKSLGEIYETISAKQLETQSSATYTPEYVPQKELIPDSPEHQPCQIKYINGRLFYGSRICLPAKLAFVAKDLTKCDGYGSSSHHQQYHSMTVGNDGNHSLSNKDGSGERINDSNNKSGIGKISNFILNDSNCDNDDNFLIVDENDERIVGSSIQCVHNIRAYAEKIIKHSSQNENKDSSLLTENEKLEDEDIKENEIKYEICDDIAHKRHAIRLNPSLYSSTPSSSSHSTHNSTAQTKFKSDSIANEIKSPKKQCIRPSTANAVNSGGTLPNFNNSSGSGGSNISGIEGNNASQTVNVSNIATISSTGNEKQRKSPTKKSLTRSPGPGKKNLNVVINTSNMINSSNETLTSTSLPTIPNSISTNLLSPSPQLLLSPVSSAAVKTAKKLKALIEENISSNSNINNFTETTTSTTTATNHHQQQQKKKISSSKSTVSVSNLSHSSLSSLSSSFSSSTINTQKNISVPLNSVVNTTTDLIVSSVTTSIMSSSSSPSLSSLPSSTPLLFNSHNNRQCNISISSPNNKIKSNTNWTRDEDKIILEEVKLGFDSEENFTNRLKTKLTNRTVNEIIQRHQFLMDVLSKLQKKT